jgi:capsular exopolysaccharide synthesis family protein
MEAQLGELKEKMERSKERLAQFARELDVVDPEQKSSVLSARLMELNTEYTKAQADRVAKEASYQSMKKGSLAAVQVSNQATSLNALAERINTLRSIFVSVQSTYGAKHPMYKKAEADLAEGIRQYDEATKQISQRIDVEYQQALERERMIRDSVTTTKADMDKLTSHALDYQQLKHEAEADTKLYEELVRRIREAGLNSGFQGNAIRMADVARPALQPVTPRPLLNMAVSFMCSLILAIGAVFLSEIVNARVHGPDQVQQDLNVRLVATLPNVRWLPSTHDLEIQDGGPSLVRYVKGLPMAKDVASYEESIRQLRNSILLAEKEGPIRSVLVTSGLPGEGKSTTALHLAISRANQRQRTLLVDADLRRPTLHTRLRIPDGPGLAEVLAGDMYAGDVIVESTEIPNLHILRAGQANGRASDLVGPSILGVLGDAMQRFDLIVVDAPPLLAFAETLQLAIAVDGVVVITRAGSTSTQAVSSVLSTLESVQARVVGVVLNRFRNSRRAGYEGYGQYGTARVTSGFSRNS